MDLPLQSGQKALHLLLAPVVRWCVRIGIGHGQFSRIVKPLFYEAAKQEIARGGIRCSDSALSLASGLHKGDIALFQKTIDAIDAEQNNSIAEINRINPSSQVIARWVALRLPKKIPTRGAIASFDSLVKGCQREGAPFLSTKLLLQDLKRRGLVKIQGDYVRLVSEVGMPNVDAQQGVVHFVGAVRDHIEACIANLEAGGTPLFLEQSIDADGLRSSSVALVNKAARQWWLEALQAITAQAIELSDQDEPAGGDQRFRFGVYFYSQAMSPSDPHS